MNRKLRSIMVTAVVFAAVMMIGTVAACAASESSAARVMINGEYLEFAQDSLPKNQNGRIMVPYRAIFEYLGLQVDYDANTKVISGKTSEYTLSMKSGNKSISLAYKDGTTKTVAMDVAPYVTGGRTFVPTRFVSEMLGYTVGWDSANKTVIVVDGSKVAENADKDFSTLMKLRDVDADDSKAYEMSGQLSAEVTSNGSTTELNGTVNGVTENSSQEFDLDLIIKDSKETQNISADVKLNSDTGDMYLKADGITEKSQWAKFSMSGLLEDSGLSMQKLIRQAGSDSVDAAELVSTIIVPSEDDMTSESYNETKEAYNALKSMLGDSAFTKSGSSYKAVFDQTVKETKVSGDITINVNAADKAESYTLNISLSGSGNTLELSMKGTSLSTEFSMSRKVDDSTSVDIKLTMNKTQTAKHPDISIPSGESTVDITDLFKTII